MNVDEAIAVLQALTPEERKRPFVYDGCIEIDSIEVMANGLVSVESAYWGDSVAERIRREKADG